MQAYNSTPSSIIDNGSLAMTFAANAVAKYSRSLLLLLAGVRHHDNNGLSGTVSTYTQQSVFGASSTYALKAGGTPIDVVNYHDYDYAHFSMDSNVAVEMTKLSSGAISSYQISPMKYNYGAKNSDSKLAFTLADPQYIVVTIDSVPKVKPLVILADPMEINPPKPNGMKVINVINSPYKADDTGKTYADGAINAAINDTSAKGGGTVYVPPGVYKSGDIVLQSNVNLYLSPGSVLRYTGEASHYTRFATKLGRGMAFFVRTAQGSSNISITGRGTIWGDGHATLNDVTSSDNASGFFVKLVYPMKTKDFHFDGPIVKEASSWHFVATASTGVSIDNAKILGRLDMGENDGIDIVESQDVSVRHCFAAVFDDAFSTKSYRSGPTSPNLAGVSPLIEATPMAVRNVIFDDTFSWTGCYGLKSGQGFYDGQNAVTFRNAVIYDCAVGFGIDHRYGLAAAEDITFENVEIERISHVLSERQTWLALNISNHDGVGPIGGITIKNITIHDEITTPAHMWGYRDRDSQRADIGSVNISDVYIAKLGRTAHTAAEMKLTDLRYVKGPLGLSFQDQAGKEVQTTVDVSMDCTPEKPPRGQVQEFADCIR